MINDSSQHPRRLPEVVDAAGGHGDGLSSEEVAARKARGEVNAAPPSPGRTYRQMCGLLLVVFVEPPNRFWAGGSEPSGDRRPAWLTVALMAGLLVIAFVPALSGIFDLRRISPLDMAVVAVAAAVWMFSVRWAWRRRLLERFLGTDPAP